MAQIFRVKKNTSAKKFLELKIVTLEHQGKGVAKHQGKVCFVEGALPGEHVKVTVMQEKAKLIEASVQKVLSPSNERVIPFCKDYSLCGGCQLQHLETNAQVSYKQQAVTKLFAKFTKVDMLPWQGALLSAPLHYRRSARIACFYDKSTKQMKLGFRGAKSKKIIEIAKCDVLNTSFISIFTCIRSIINAKIAYRSISHIQLCDADNAQFILLRHTKAISEADKAFFENELLSQVACSEVNYNLIWDNGDEHNTHYKILPSYEVEGIKFTFKLDNFIQVNDLVNQAMLKQAIKWLNLNANNCVLDLFCGIGNFSLLLAKQANKVVGVEGSSSSVAMAKQNAHTNNIMNTEFYSFDLTCDMSSAQWFSNEFDTLVLDPSRTGAYEVLQQLPLTQFKTVLYVSCDPVTLARDSQLIIAAGFVVDKIGLMNMFPHTGHIETMALFKRR